MKMTRISVALPIPGGVYAISGGRSYSACDDTVVSVETDAGITGWGEVCALGANYLPVFGAGARAGIGEVAPHLIGADPMQIEAINTVMDAALLGHAYAKSPLDLACWDIQGQAAGVPVSDLLGGRFGGGTGIVSSVPSDTPAGMAANIAGFRAQGYPAHSFKIGYEPKADLARIHAIMAEALPEEEFHADANRGWTLDQALRVMRGARAYDIYFEQPCATYGECLALRRRTDQPMVLDEIVTDAEAVLRIIKDDAADMINIKISRVGGLTKARRIRDICAAAGLAMTIQDSCGSEISQAAILHLAQSTPEQLRRSVWDATDLSDLVVADGGQQATGGHLRASEAPGLGISPRMGVLGAPVAVYGM